MNKKSKVLLGIVFLIILLAIFFIWRNNQNNTSHKPMVKVNDTVYYWAGDVEVDISKLEQLGLVEKSYENLMFELGPRDENFSSNYYTVGTKIYKHDDKSILLVGDGFQSILKEKE